MLPLLVMMNSEAHKMVLSTASTTFRNISVCQSSQKLHPLSKSPRTGACFYSEAHFCLRSFNGLLISIIKKFLIQIFRFFYNILGLSCSKLLCFEVVLNCTVASSAAVMILAQNTKFPKILQCIWLRISLIYQKVK